MIPPTGPARQERSAHSAPAPEPEVKPSELDALLSAIAGAIEALVAWDITALQSASERQRALCDRLAGQLGVPRDVTGDVTADGSAGLLFSPASAATARKVRELNRVYDRLLQHSIQWTRTIHSILEAGGHSFPTRASVHFRG